MIDCPITIVMYKKTQMIYPSSLACQRPNSLLHRVDLHFTIQLNTYRVIESYNLIKQDPEQL